MRERHIREAPFDFVPSWTSTDRPAATQLTNASAFAENERGDSLSMQHDVGDDFEGNDSKGC